MSVARHSTLVVPTAPLDVVADTVMMLGPSPSGSARLKLPFTTVAGTELIVTVAVSSSTVPVTVETDLDGRLPPTIEATAYFVAAEALTNTAKHADASASTIRARQTDDRLVVEIADDGRGGADLDRGSGLRGLEDRVTALGGTLRISSPPGGGTVVAMDLPCASS